MGVERPPRSHQGSQRQTLLPTVCHPTPTRVPPTHLPSYLSTQVPEDFGPVRTVAEGHGDTLYVGTTRNSILQGSVHTGFSLLVQVRLSPLHPSPLPSSFPGLPCIIHSPSPLPVLLTSLLCPFSDLALTQDPFPGSSNQEFNSKHSRGAPGPCSNCAASCHSDWGWHPSGW